jgi:glycosyltransferase involved in cell wall biosynthesis
MKKKRILFTAQLPPPVHGAALMNEIIVNSPLIGQYFECRHINISTAGQIEDIGKFSPGKIFSAIRHLFLILTSLITYRPHIIYFTLSPSGFAFFRDSVYFFFMRLSGSKVVFHLHGKGIKEGAGKSRLFRWLSKKIFSRSYVIFLSEKLRSDVPFPSRAPYVVNYGVPVVAQEEKVPSPAGKKVEILYISNYVRTKGVIDLIDAVALVARTHQHFHLTLAGKPYDISLEFLESHTREKGLAGKVTIHGPKYKEEKTALLQASDVFILPTYYENEAFPLSILEAMQFTLPVISTYEGGIPDMIDDGVNGLLFHQRDINQLAEKILFLLDDPAARVRLGRAARQKFMQKYTVSIFEQHILETLQDIAGA